MNSNSNRNGNRNSSKGVGLDDFVFYAITLSVILKSVSFLPLLHAIHKKKYTRNIPWLTVIMNWLASLLLIVVSAIKGYMPQLFLFVIFFISCSALAYYKIKNDGFRLYEDEDYDMPSRGDSWKSVERDVFVDQLKRRAIPELDDSERREYEDIYEVDHKRRHHSLGHDAGKLVHDVAKGTGHIVKDIGREVKHGVHDVEDTVKDFGRALIGRD